MGSCRECGGALKGGEPWCPRCHTRVLAPDEEEAQIGSLFGAIHEGHIEARKAPWQVDDRHTAPRLETRYSRWQGGLLSPGPAFRVAATLVLMLPLLAVPLIWQVGGPVRAVAFIAAIGYPLACIPLLRVIWVKTPIE